jgi:hypothetical protein
MDANHTVTSTGCGCKITRRRGKGSELKQGILDTTSKVVFFTQGVTMLRTSIIFN